MTPAIRKDELKRGAAYIGPSRSLVLTFPTMERATSYMSIELPRLAKVSVIDYAMLTPEEEGGYQLMLKSSPYCRYDMETITTEDGKRKRLYSFDSVRELQEMIDREYYPNCTFESQGTRCLNLDGVPQLDKGAVYRVMAQDMQLGTVCYEGGRWKATMRNRRR